MAEDSGSLAVFRDELLKISQSLRVSMATFYSYKALETEEKETAVLNSAFRLQKTDSQARSGTRRRGVTPGAGLYLKVIITCSETSSDEGVVRLHLSDLASLYPGSERDNFLNFEKSTNLPCSRDQLAGAN